MNKARKQFVRYAMAAVFVLLLVLLTIINAVNFTMAAADADAITERLSQNQGSFQPEGGEPSFTPGERSFTPGSAGSFRPEGFGPMGPDTPDMNASVRYFTVRFEKESATLTAFRISAVSEEEAVAWAQTLTKEGTGWTRGTYRYRTYQEAGATLVTVIDQGRELLPSFRILIISLIGIVLGLIISFLFLSFIGKKLFAPLEEADRKQKQFLTEAEKEFKVPLTVIHADAELIERETGPSEYTSSIHRQVSKMTELVKNLGSLALFEEESAEEVSLSDILLETADAKKESFSQKGMELALDIAPGVMLSGSGETLHRIAEELLENALKFGGRKASVTLLKEGERIQLICANEALLPDGNYENAFDRFTRLENASGIPGAGLGLSFVKEAAKSLGGRVSARVEGGQFRLTLSL